MVFELSDFSTDEFDPNIPIVNHIYNLESG
jgi:hypothetical protein